MQVFYLIYNNLYAINKIFVPKRASIDTKKIKGATIKWYKESENKVEKKTKLGLMTRSLYIIWLIIYIIY